MAYGTNAPFGLRPLYSLDGGTWVEKLTEYQIPTGYGISIFTGDLVTLNTLAASVNQIALYLPILTQTAGNTANTFTPINPVLGVFQGCRYTDATTKVDTPSPYWPANTQVVPGTPIIAYVNDDPSVVWEAQVSTYINANASNPPTFAGGNTPATSAGPFFPGTSGTAANTSGIGSNYSIMGGGGTNFNTIPNPVGGFYANNPTSTFQDQATATPITVTGINPFGGNTLTGQSGAYLCVSTYGDNDTTTFTAIGVYNAAKDYDHTVNTLPLKVLGYSPNSRNLPLPNLTLAQTPFVNVMVMINNHVFKPGTPGQTFA